MIEACPTCLAYFFSEIQATVEYYTKIFGLKLIETCTFGYHRHEDGGLCQN